MSKPITDQEFLDAAECPWCKSEDLHYSSSVTFGGDFVTQDVECAGCGKKFQQVYNLVGYEEA